MARLDLLELASRVSGGAAVDWDAVERDAEPEERRVVRRLRLLESIARVHHADEEDIERDTAPSQERIAAVLPSGTTWGGLELRARLGEGAFGEVFRAYDPRLEREVALKLLKAHAKGKEKLAARVLREGRLLARVRHPNVVMVHGVETHEGRVGLWMERVEGRSLDTWLEEHGPLGAREAALVGIDLCRALAAVHGAGLVHRDVKAGNVMREKGGRIVLMDFGAGEEASTGGAAISGTPIYIAPEVWRGEAATARADLWSVGVLLYHLLTGSYPVRARRIDELREKLERREIRLLRDERPDLPEALLRAVERALEWDPATRYSTAGEMERALAAALGVEAAPAAAPAAAAPRRGASRKPAVWLAAAAVLAGAIALGVVLLRPRAGGAYTVEAALVRMSADGTRERLASGDRVRPGDGLALELTGSRDLYVYVMNRDERGHSYVLFPLPGLEAENPLRAGTRHTVPGRSGDRDLYWQINSAGGREHVLILASPERQIELEAELAKLPRPAPGALAQALPGGTTVRLRGMGGLVEGAAAAPVEAPAERLFDMAESLAGGAQVTRGAWLRRIELENPE